MILARDTRRQPNETRDPLTWTSQTAKKAKANKARHKRLRLGECFHLHSRSHLVSGSLSESVYPALGWSKGKAKILRRHILQWPFWLMKNVVYAWMNDLVDTSVTHHVVNAVSLGSLRSSLKNIVFRKYLNFVICINRKCGRSVYYLFFQ